jgi:valyl-tRNA synthetase
MLAFTLENKKYMEGDIRRLGTSCDWSREKFTLDEDVVKKVRASFVKLYQDGLVYRANRIVNWCIKHQTSLSDVETESREQEDALYYITYGPITIATVRPETIFGDVAIAVHPDDERYQSLIGKTVIQKTPIGEREIPVIADAYVEKDFGTGALKITPAHDANDFMIGQKHKLEAISVIDKIGKLTAVTGKYEGMKIADARKAVIADLEEMGLLVKTEPYKHAVKCCYKCQNIIEPRIMEQWFVKMQPLAERALGAVKAKEITFLPERFETMFSYWMENTIDWNISRQIVWGIKIPAWYKDGEIFVGEEVPQGEGWREETDVFDTWFSSGQWPYLVLGYPDSKDFKAFYPADILETGADLVFKWVPRMVFFSKYFTGQIPFKTVYFHGMVNDAQGKKMSKSKGNVMSPIDLIDEFGADALRMALIVGNPAGSDSALSKDKIRGYRNFTTKIWNMAKFILKYSDAIVADVKATPRDNEVFSELAKIKAEISGYLNEYKLHLAAETIYHYIWHTVADKIIEEFKPRLGGVDLDDRRAAATTLLAVFAESRGLATSQSFPLSWSGSRRSQGVNRKVTPESLGK